MVVRYENLSCSLINEVFKQVSANETLFKSFKNVVTIFNSRNFKSLNGSAIVITNDNILRNVNKTTGKITRVSGT